MSKHPQRTGRDKPSKSSTPKSRNLTALCIGVALVAVTAFGVWWWQTQPAVAPPPVATPADSQATNPPPPAATATARPEFQKLKGKWQRPDGGYVLEIKGVDAGGKLDAAYFNPKPIHVAQAEASLVGAAIKVFIELRDVNYPGSTYTLAYDPGTDQFKGIYYQALQQQSFEVNFVRMQ